MKTTTHRKHLLALHRSQQRLFAGTLKTLQGEFGKLPGAEAFLDSVSRLAELLREQTTAAEAIFTRGGQLVAAGGPDCNRSPELMKPTGSGAYDFLNSKRLLAEHIGNLDEYNKALFYISQMMEAAKPFRESKPKVWERAAAMSWRLSSGQCQIHALTRYVDAITATQEAILRSYGLKIWQGHKRHLRWEGDDKSDRIDKIAT